MLITLTAPAFAETWYIEDGDITVKASGTEGKNTVSQGNKKDVEDTNTIITNQNKDKASSNTVTIEAKDKDDKVEVTLKDVNIDTSSRNKAAVSVTGEGDTNIKLNGDNALKSDIYRSGIYGSGSLTISGGENDSLTAQGGAGGSGIHISRNGSLTISGGTVTANGGNGDYSGGDGISSSDRVAISGSTVTANGGDSSSRKGASGISSSSGVTVSGGTVNANGGNGDYNGGSGISSFDRVAVSGGTVTANGGSGNFSGGDGISSSGIDLSGSLELTAKAGSPSGRVLSQNGDELDLNTIKDKLGPGAKVTATDANGKALSQRGYELDLDTIKDKLGPGAKVTATDADGKVIDQVPIPRPVEPEESVIPGESSSSSDGGSATPSAPASPLPGLTVTDKDGQRISYTSTQSGNTLTVCVGRLTASLHVSLAALRQLRAEGIETIAFQTILCSTTLSVDELLAMGGEDAEVVLTHHIRSSTLTVGGKAV